MINVTVMVMPQLRLSGFRMCDHLPAGFGDE